MRNKVVISLLTATAVPMGAMANADVSAKVEASDAHKLTAEGQTGHLSEAGMLAAQALGANDNDDAYAEVASAVAEATKFYNKAVDDVVKTLGGAVWEGYRDVVLKELAVYYQAIVAVGKNNGTDDAHENAFDNKEANLAALEDAKAGITAKKDEAINKFKACEKAYADAKGVVAGFTTRFADVKKLLVDPTKPHTEDVDNIQGLIDALTAKIEDANDKHTIDKLDYSEKQAAIEAALTTLSTEATAEKANYEAKLRLVAEQTELQTAFEAAKAAAALCKEGSFDGEALWQETVTSLTNTVATCQSAIDNHYGEGDCAVEESTISGSINAAKSAVANYKAEVEQAFADYKEAQTAIAGYQEALDAVKEYVKNPIVPCSGTTQTYGDVIDGLQGRIKAVTAALNTVMAENKDGKLAAALASLDLDDVLLDEIAVITQDKYEKDKAAYDKQNKVDAAKTCATTVSSKVTEKEKKLSDLWTKLQENPAAYGLSWNTLVDTKNALNDSLNDVKAALPADEDAINKDNADKWLTDLPAISKTLDAISADIDKLATDAETIKSKVVANKNFYDARTADVEAERKELDKITTTDPDKAHEVAADKADAVEKLDGFQSEIYFAYTEETLEADWSKGLAKEWTDIQTTIAEYVANAEQVEDNFQACTAQTKMAQFDDVITAAAEELKKDEVCTGDGRAHFKGVLAGYKKEADDLISNIHAWYGEGTSAEHTDSVKAKTQELIANIKAVPTLAHANDSVHTVQTNKLTEVQAEWTRVYNRFSAEDESSKKQAYLSDMANFQLRINELDKLISDAFAAGTSVQGAYEDSLTLLKVEITNKEAAWNGEYDKTLAKDNAARYENFCKAYDDALTKYSKVAGNIEKFNAVSEVYFPGKAEIIKVAKDELYQFSLDIIALKKTARDEYEHLPERTLYDPTEAHTTEVSSIIAQMNATYEAFLEQANSSACAQYKTAYEDASKCIKDALKELGTEGINGEEGRKYDYDMLDEVFAGVLGVLDKNFVADHENDEMLATKVEVLITNLNTVPDSVAAAKEDASQRWYAATMADLTALHDAQLDTLTNEFKYAEVVNSTEILDVYENAWEKNIVNGAKAIGDAAVESNTMYLDYYRVKNLISDFEEENGYAAAVAAAQQNTNSLAAYAEIMDSLAATQDKLDALKAYADGYFVDGSDYVNKIQEQLDDILGKANSAKYWGTAEDNKEGLLGKCADAESNITAAYKNVDGDEFLALMDVYVSIKDEFVSASSELDANAIEEYQKTIEAYPTRMGEILKTEDAAARHAAFIALEKEMAATKTELVALYDEAKIDGIYAELCDAIAAVSTQQAAAADTLATMHQPVQDQFSEQLAAIVTAVESAQAAVDADKAASTLILYADNRKAEVAALQQQLDDLTSAIADEEASYVVNDEVYARLTEELQGYKTAADSVAERIHSYGDAYINQESFDRDMQSQVYDKLTLAEEALETAHNATEVGEMLKENSKLDGCSNVMTDLTRLDKEYSYDEGNGYINEIKKRWTQVYNSWWGSNYDDETSRELESKINEIFFAWQQISETHNQAYDDPSAVEEYCTVVVPAVRDSLAELSDQLEALQTEVEEKSYTPGDVNRDGKILVDDYSAVLDVALEYTTYEPGSVEFLAADINGDGRVNIGDVTAVARILRGENAQGVRAIARTGMQQVTDALGFAAEGTGTRQRIAISLDGSRDYVGGQLDIRLPQGVTLVGESLGQAAEGLNLQSNDLQDGAHRVLFSSPEGTLMGRSGVLLYLEVEVSHSYSGEGFDVANVLLADEAARTYALATPADGEATGVGRVSLTEEWKTKVYNLGGILMDGLKRGVNILRGSDGTSRKVIVK